MKVFLSIIWYFTSILLIYLAILLSKKYQFRQFNLKKIFKSFKSKSKNNISPLASLNTTLAAKIGVGSLSGVALAIYYGGVGTIFWIVLISLFLSINTYYECLLGIKYRDNEKYIGGPSYYISKCLGNKKTAVVYSILVIITYSGLFLSIQANTIISVTDYLNINDNLVIILLVSLMLIIIFKGIDIVVNINKILVPIMFIFYVFLGLYVFFNNYLVIPKLLVNIFIEAFRFKSIIAVFLIGMQRAIFISESSLGTSAISASTCDNLPDNQGMMEVGGIYVTIFVVSLITFFIIATSDYNLVNFSNLNGIEIVIYAFNYHFGDFGGIILSFVTILFAFSTMISCYFFGNQNLNVLSNKIIVKIIFKVFFVFTLILSCYVKANILWNLTDYFVALLVIINVVSMLKINSKIG